MLKRSLPLLVLLYAAVLGAEARAQEQTAPLPPEAEQYFQALRDFGNQMAANLNKQGIVPRDFLRQIRQLTKEDGTPDEEAQNQLYIDKGVITAEMLKTMHASGQNWHLATVRKELNSSDEEWAIIQAKIQRILVAAVDVEINTRNADDNSGGQSITSGAFGELIYQNDSETTKAWTELKAILKVPNAPEASILAKLKAWRDAHERAKGELAVARADLLRVVTLRQEAILLGIGLL